MTINAKDHLVKYRAILMRNLLVGFAAALLLIVADDLGYSDFGGFGGEIPTPS